jgi:scyllo-inositol 2-dehydrogenase (NADP+)
MTVSVGMVGFGFSGATIHAPLIRAAGMRVEAVVTTRPSQARAICPDARIFGGLTEMLENHGLDLVLIATPNHLHVTQATASLLAGCHVVIDKPAALDTLQVDELISIAKACDRKISVFHNRRWDSDFLTLERLLRADRLGEISAFETRWDRFRPRVAERWRENRDSGGGILLDLGTHLVDQALRLFGRPHWVQASVVAQRPHATVDDAFEILMMKGPLLIKLGVSSLAPLPAPRYRVHGSRGTFLKAGLDIQEQQLRDGRDPLAADFGCEPEAQWGTITAANGGAATMANLAATESVTPARGCWLEYYRLMRASIESGGPVPVSLEEARETIAVLDAARRSSAAGRRIDLEEPPLRVPEPVARGPTPPRARPNPG